MATPQTIEEIETPAVIVDLPKVEANLRRVQDYADGHGLPLRPHIKTHKLPLFAKRQLELGAAGITCQKLGEAEIMADAGISDIFLAYNILGQSKLRRLRALAERIDLSVAADNAVVVDGYGEAFADAARPLKVVVECDTGGGRCGVQTPGAALALARTISEAPGLSFQGLMTYPAPGTLDKVNAWLAAARALFTEDGITINRVSNGGTPDLWNAHTVEGVTEHRPGSMIYMDRNLFAYGACALDDCALTVLSMIVSRPTDDRAILDAGSKALAADPCPLGGHGAIIEYPEATIYDLNEEHGKVDVSGCARGPRIGDIVRVIPNHVCVVSNLFDMVHLVDGDRVLDVLPVVARGKLT